MAPVHDTLRPLDTLWQARALLWVVLAGESLAVVLALAPGVAGDRLAYFGIASLTIQWVAFMTLGILYLARRRLAEAPPPVVAQVALAALLLATGFVGWLAWVALGDLPLAPGGGWVTFVLRLAAIALVVGLIGVAAFNAQWHARQLALRAKQAELEALRARIRPHFLFNTLNTGLALLRARPDAAERLLLDLSDLFRAALGGRGQIPLQEELSLARRYLEIERLRFGERLRLDWEIPEPCPAIDGIAVPPLSLQPLVENAIRHGIEPDAAGGRIAVSLRAGDGMAVVTVRNTLPRNAPSDADGHGVGLAAVRARIEAFTGGRGGLETRNDAGEYVAELSIPAIAGTAG